MRRRSASRSRWAAGAVLALVGALGLGGCSDDEPEPSSSAPLEVTEGEGFTWNDFTVEDGWELKGVERTVDMEKVTTPEVSGTIVNNSSEERAAIFSMVFSLEGDPVATVNCSAKTMAEGQSVDFLCPGVNTFMPEDYDALTVTEFTRKDPGSDSDESGA